MSRRRRESVRFAYGGGGGRVFVFSPPHLGLAYHISLPKHEREIKENKIKIEGRKRSWKN